MEIRHESERGRFVADLEEGRALLDYARVDERTWDLRRTWVPESQRGRGVARSRVRHVPDRAAGQGVKVSPSCWFVETFLEAHPDYRELVAEQPRG